MPGYVIHLAVAEEYMRKNPNEIKNRADFLRGTVEPDFVEKVKKGESHYGESSSILYLRKYLESNMLDSDYKKGYFLHLVTDYIFYNKLLNITSKQIYNDFDILNEYLINKYNVNVLPEVKDKVFFLTGNTKILHKDLAEKTIKIVSDMKLSEIEKEIKTTKYIEKWDKIRKLKRID